MSTDVELAVDLIVAGGGPIGLAASIEARLAGLSVAIIEPRENEIDKACGEGLMPGALPLLARLGVRPEGMPLLGVSYRNGRAHADHYFRAGAGLGVRRTTLHAALSNRADELGVERVSGRVDSVSQGAESVSVDIVHGGIPKGAGLRASWLFGSDGLHSTVRRLVGLERPVSRRGRRFGLRQHFFVEPWSELIEVHWGERVEAYVTPVSKSIVGIAILGAARANFHETLKEIPELADHLKAAEPASSLRGAGPFRQRAARPVTGRVLLIGDASGYVDAITGEGLRLGLDQARAAVACVLAGRPSDYAREWKRTTRDSRVLTTGLVAAATSPLRGAIVPVARALPTLFGAAVERLAR